MLDNVNIDIVIEVSFPSFHFGCGLGGLMQYTDDNLVFSFQPSIRISPLYIIDKNIQYWANIILLIGYLNTNITE